MTKCVQLVEQDGSGGLAVCEAGATALRELTGSFYVVCIAGLYRSGKSLLLNKLARWLGDSGADFKVGNTTDSCTRGIWMCIVGEYILLDTEGLASVDQDETYDTKIFTLGLLLSSYFVYNSMGVIDEAAIDRLHMVGTLAASISKSNKVGFPLLWLLRDFSLNLDKFQDDPNAYLEDALQDKAKKSSNIARQELRKIFRNRQCRVMVRPLLDERKLQQLDHVEDATLRPEFLEQMESLFTLIKDKATRKKLSGQLLTGPMLVNFLQACLGEINGGAVPDIKKTFEYVAEESYREVSRAAEAMYLDEMGERLDKCSEWMQVLAAHEEARRVSLELFKDDKVLESASKGAFIAETSAKLGELFVQVLCPRMVAQSVSASEKQVSTILQGLDEENLISFISELSFDPEATQALGPERFHVFSKALLRDILHSKIVPYLDKQHAALTHCKERCSEFAQQLENERASHEESQVKLQETQQALVMIEKDLAKTTEQLTSACERAEIEKQQLDSMVLETRSHAKGLEDQLAEERREHAKTRERLEVKGDQLQQETSRVSEIHQEMARLRESEQYARKDAEMLRTELDDLIQAAALEQREFDLAKQQFEEKELGFQVERCLYDVIQMIEFKHETLARTRVKEERDQLHAKLQQFLLKASELPEFFQSVFY